MTLRLTKRAIRVLTARYRAVLLAAIMGSMATTNAMATGSHSGTVTITSSSATDPAAIVMKSGSSATPTLSIGLDASGNSYANFNDGKLTIDGPTGNLATAGNLTVGSGDNLFQINSNGTVSIGDTTKAALQTAIGGGVSMADVRTEANGGTPTTDTLNTIITGIADTQAATAVGNVETKLGAGATGYDINAKSLQVQGKDVLTTDSSIAAAKVTEDATHKFVTNDEKTQIGTNTTNISANTAAIATLNGDASTAGSVAKAIADAASNYVAADLSNLTDAQKNAINSGVTAANVTQIGTNKSAIETLNGAETAAGSVKNTAKGYADTAETNAKNYTDTATTLTAAGKNYAANDTALQAIAKLDTVIGDASSGLTKAVADNTSAIATLNGGETDAGSVKNIAKGYADTALATANTNIDNAITYDSTTGKLTFKNSDGSTVDGAAYTADKADATFAALTGNNTFSGTNTFTNGLSVTGGSLTTTGNATIGGTLGAGATTVASLTSTGNAAVGGTLNAGATTVSSLTSTGAVSGTTGTFSGAISGASLSTSGNAAVGGTLNAGATTVSSLTSTGAVSGTTGTFTGALKSEGLDAGSGLIKTTGALQAGDATVSSLNAGSGTVKTTGAVEAGTLAVTGASTFNGLATMNAGLAMGGKTVTAIETAAVAAGAGKTDTLATTSSVLASAQNGTYSGTKVKGDTASATLGAALDKGLTALNNVLIADGSKVDDAKVEVLWNSTNSTLETVLGNGAYTSTNQLTAGDSVTTALSALDTAVGNTTFSGKNATGAADLTVAVNSLDTAIGDRSTLSATNGNLTAGSDIVTALNALDGTLGNVKALDGTDTSGPTGNLAPANSTVAQHLTAIDTRMGQINGLVANATDTTTTTGKAYYGNLAVGTTVEDHLEALDASIGDRRNYTNQYNIANDQAVADSLDALDTVIGDIANMTNAGGNLGADVATSLDGLDAAIGTRNYTSTKYVTAGDDLTTAVSSLDQNLDKVENRVAGLEDRTQKMNREMKAGFASLAAMSALVPNARSAGDTQISLGTGYYRGTAGFALGAFHHFNDNVMMNVGAGYSAHGAGTFRAGVTFGF